MKTTFMRALKGLSKYFVFSVFFIMALFVKGNEVNAASPDLTYSPNKTGVGTSSGSITSIGGKLATSCVAPSEGNYLPYEIVGSNHSGNGEYTGCIAYIDDKGTTSTSDDTQVFYVQAKQDGFTKITFKVSGITQLHNYVAVFEDDFTLSETDNYDYDQYRFDSVNNEYVYSRKLDGSKDDNEDGTLTVAGTGSYVYTFTYTLRDAPNRVDYDGTTLDSADGDEYGEHNLYVYFYDAEPNANNGTKGTEISYTLAKPISEYGSSILVEDNLTSLTATTCNVDTDTAVTATNIANDQICILYVPKPNTGGTDNNTKTNNFVIKASNNIALYFSTVNTHTDVVTNVTSALVKQYNTIYATNNFENSDGSGISYNYFNAIDSSSYDYAISTTNDNFYTFTFTIDASGNYTFTLTDVFGNTVTSTQAAVVEDISNRTLSTYYIKYGDAPTNSTVGEYGPKGEGNTPNEAFELKDNLSILTNENVTIGLEFYYKVKISGNYGVVESGSILNNPLAKSEIRFADSEDATKARTYYCRMADATVTLADSYDMCVVAGKGSNFTLNKLDTAQSIDANTTTGLKAVSNLFTYYNGILNTSEISAVTTRTTNRVSFEINENGRYYVRLQDTHGNSMFSTIDVSIIDQLNPVITFNGDNTSLNNKLCSSMYVIGAGGTIQGYPTDVISDCSANSVTYDHFDEVDTTNGTEKKDEVRAEFKILRSGTQGDTSVSNNGFYNKGTSSVVFNYADAIRMALLKATDSISVYNNNSFVKSIYRKVDANTTYTEYGIYTYNSSLVENKYTFGSDGRHNMMNDHIIESGYIQYSSELYSYFTDSEYVWFNVYTLKADGSEDTKVCSSQIDGASTRERVQSCYDLVNAYIDKSISFVLEFFVRDYVGNVSIEGIKVKIDVVDDTTPGITKINEETGEIQTDPIIAKNNIDTTCRLEIGSIIQNKIQLLQCYGFLSGGQYYFVDNATTYTHLTIDTMANNYYNNVLLAQLYTNTAYTDTTDTYSYANNIVVSICSKSGDGACSGANPTGEWVTIPNSVENNDTYKFVNAGDYEIRFEITDSGKDYAAAHTKNKTTIIACYYVNPRILLVRPLEETKVYGVNSQNMDYCIYATTNTNAFFYNIFNLPASYGGDTYKFIQDNYENSTHGIVYCTNDPNPTSGNTLDNAKKVTVDEILAKNTGAELEGELARTYATGVNKYNLELGTSTYNAYEDAGYYYITLGDLGVNAAHKDNYIVRLHPNYLLDGMTPNVALKSYDHADLLGDDTYKYGTTKNTVSHGETISNVLFTITQAELVINANGGSKMYGNTDTNYKQAFNTNATNNISEITTNTSTVDVPVKYNPSVSGYLNGFTIEGLITTVTDTSKNVLNDYSYVTNGYNNIIFGFLRRDGGENVGRYYICNNITPVINTLDHSTTGCDIAAPEINTLGTKIDLSTSNVYVLNADGSYTLVAAASDIVYGRYVGIDSDGDSSVDTYYKLTRNNTDLTNKKFDDDLAANLWRYNYDDSNYSVKILVNNNNANQNYYIVYNDAMYTINPGEVIVQPGMNQGKEYSNPEHNDPIFEIVVYGEMISISASETVNTSFNGYTQSIEAIGYPHEDDSGDSYNKKIDTNTYSSTANNKAADTDVYFSDRRTTSHEVTATYVYEYNAIALTENKFTLDGVSYVVSGSNICVVTDTSECITSGEKIGAKTLTISGSSIIVTVEGKLTYQDYRLFTSDANGANAGSGYITRATGLNVGWYSYIYESSKLHVVSNASNISQATKNYCTHTSYTYSVGGTGNCANYNVTFNANAATKNEATNEFKTTTTPSSDGYLHNGNNVCTDANMYSVACDNAKKGEIQFLIFKRDVILSFNSQSYVYGQVYSYFDNDNKDGKFDITKNGVSALPDVKGTTDLLFTCYRKASSDEAGYLAANNKRYIALSESECNSVDYGISDGDVWGENGLNLQFFLHNNVGDVFVESYYPIPAGLYFVYASIGTVTDASKHGTDATFVHDDYNLVYIDYDILVKGTTTDGTTFTANNSNKNGALEITSRAVKLQGTYYQKEFGQALYKMYDENGSELTYTANSDGTVTYSLDNGATIKIFDNNYYYCEIAGDSTYNGQTIKYGCNRMVHSSTEANYLYSDISNVYLYTVIDDGDTTNNDSSFGPMKHAATKYDEIIANFAGTPIRLATGQTSGTTYVPKATGDNYGLLDDVGYYTIYLNNIIPVVAQYDGITFSKDTGTIFRDENYSISEYISGMLYITPAQIDITVSANQTKMYGCSYNTIDTSITDSTYSYANGYANCVETVDQYYDLGYEYTVVGDKANYLKDNTSVYTGFAACSDLATRENPSSCADISYDADDITYKVTPNYGTEQSDGSVGGAVGNGKPTNTSLNSGTLYRIYVGSDTETSFSYQTYFEYATNAQLAPTNASIKFQEQQVGTYAITLGNLDAAFNSNKHCNATSTATSLSANITSLCKNFIVVYGGNNTSKHTNSSATVGNVGVNEVFTDSGNHTLTVNDFKFTIQTRNVVVTTEYNYKVYGDTDPNEGYTCADLDKMFTYPSTSIWYGKEFDLDGRGYCSDADTFIHTGVARFYAIDNSLAKAPWTAWIDNGNEANTYYKYNDALYDVLSTSSKVNRKGENTSTASQNDAVGKYALEYSLSLNNGTNGNGANNYVINYLANKENSASNVSAPVLSADGFTIGFAADIQGTSTAATLVTLDRWYRDANHKCIEGTELEGCNAYTGSEIYKFQIDGITHNTTTYTGNKYYAFTTDNNGDSVTEITNLYTEVYFEIVRREIFIQTIPVVKDYGIEEKYTDFTVRLCSEYTGNVCTEVRPATEWGVRNSLSIEDYIEFYGSANSTTFDQIAFKGSDIDSDYRGGVDDKAFGIYMYRTYGENVGSYVIVACPTQFANDLACRTYYHNKATTNATVSADDSKIANDVGIFTHSVTTNAYNASNYIVKTIPAIITINVRNIYITPDESQGFMYGNYETGDKIAPITYYEEYVIGNSIQTGVSGLVNGSLKDASDHVNNQVALCIYDISERLTCINDRQNDNDREIKKYVTTGLHNSGTSTDITTTIGGMAKDISNALDQSNRYGLIQNNIYNDTYATDNDATRNALNRKLKNGTTTNEIDQRYNRNVGTYVITQGELTTHYCDVDTATDCLNTNYAIYGFKENVEYVISPATIIVTPKDGQSKIYGNSDVHLTFDVQTIFTYHVAPNATDADRYYCNNASSCQDTTFTNQIGEMSASNVITLKGFAYAENVYEADNTTISSYNYGISKVSNKTNTEEKINSAYGADKARYYDKYCLNASSVSEIKDTDGCLKYTSDNRLARVLFEETSRILLGYFYVEGYYQQVSTTHKILSGITVAKNEYGNVNYLYKANVSDEDTDLVGVGDETGKTFEVKQLDVTVTIQDITKVYGQATDSYKCDYEEVEGHYVCGTDNAINDASRDNAALDNEGRLEYNFNVTGDLVDTTTESGKVILVTHITQDGDTTKYYYTETGNAEYKNIHLGLTVVRAINAVDADNNVIVCGLEDDKFGCEDAGEYVLVFRKQAVTNNVDHNYNIKYGESTTASLSEDESGYATVASTTKAISETLGDQPYTGDARTDSPSYIVYKNSASELDTPFTNQNSKENPTSATIDIISGYAGKLTIEKRNIMFYIGTYDDDATVTQRFVIEQNEQIPVFPKLNAGFTTYASGEYSATDPYTKQTHYVTWFDINQYGVTKEDTSKTYAPRQVRTSDILVTEVEESLAAHNSSGVSLYGIYICKSASTDIQSATYATCGEKVLYSDANKIVDGKYVFDTSVVGDYPLVRNRETTYILNEDYEDRNYVTEDYNGTLVIYEDQTPPEIQIGNETFAIEANADLVAALVDGETCVTNSDTTTFSYSCSVIGKLFDEVDKVSAGNGANRGDILGQIIKYITLHFSGYNLVSDANGNKNVNELPENHSENKLPDDLNNLDEDWIYQPVNNIGVKYSLQGSNPTTLYDVYRTANTYDFDADYIDSNLEAISTIISWFNVNSYDYSYVRGEGEYADYISKRYTPRYYFYISGNSDYELANFDPTYVGDFKITIYAIDDVGNQSSSEVTLKIVDTTKPTTGELHVFNHQVECSASNCQTNTIDSWTVEAGYVPIDAFIRYKKNNDDTYTEDNTNGIYIKLNGSYVNIYSDEVIRYESSGTKNILGEYVLVTAGNTKAIEVEHKYWSDIATKYIVVVGGKDNSFIDVDQTDDRSQWDTYYATSDIDNWYKYERHANVGTPITFKDGSTSLYTRVVDNGRKFVLSQVNDGYVYYNNIYLRYVEGGGNACADLADCEVVDASTTKEIAQVSDAPMTQDATNANIYTFKIHSITVTYDGSKVTWAGNDEGKDVNSNSFSFGIMTCTMDLTSKTVDCTTEYKLLYNKAAGDKKELDKPVYTISDLRNMGDWDEIATVDGDGNAIAITTFYKDRRYIFVDTKAPTFTLSSDGYSVFEYDEKCSPSEVDTNGSCSISYREHFINASDTIASSTQSSISATAITDTTKLSTLSKLNFTDIVFYTGSEFTKKSDVSGYTTSGILENDSLVTGGSVSLDSDVDTSTSTTFNKYKVDLVIYLTATSGNTNYWYKYTAIYNGSSYYVYRQTYSDSAALASLGGYARIEAFAGSATMISSDKTTIEDVLQYIVSTASIDSAANKFDLTYSINYVIRDAANNASAPVANVTVRGVTYTRLESTIYVSVPQEAAASLLSLEDDNTYSMSVNQGTSLSTLLNGFAISNVNNSGINNMSTVMQSLYYNGEVLFENIAYNSNILSIIDSYAAPGTYTLKLTSTREVTSQGKTYIVNDDPLTINFVINPALAHVETSVDYSNVIVPIMLMTVFSVSLIVFGYTRMKKKKSNE